MPAGAGAPLTKSPPKKPDPMAGPPPVRDRLAPPALPSPAVGDARVSKSMAERVAGGGVDTYPPGGCWYEAAWAACAACMCVGRGGPAACGGGAGPYPWLGRNKAARALACASAVDVAPGAAGAVAAPLAAAAVDKCCKVGMVSATVVVLLFAVVSTRKGVAVPGGACCTVIIACRYWGARCTTWMAAASAGVCGLDTTKMKRGDGGTAAAILSA